ncbi:OPT family small oligopeptide transporter [Candidozyma pseudohaemuli]|uniref:OPT family small oligopeptide transporter n=1 Tax=Candidozyma pseudohaemuli TaxID=418784 RepID=A0A2P7YNS4_9ASCO|nr:OPT family small oligopeptide transporter [[Candida] pseudohaemulonii]PSK37590.1 OPT family small oligopeptide transporter [[Candida] pseudohaemulonii]
MAEKVNPITSVTSAGNRLDAADHELDLNAVTSNPLSLGDVAAGLTLDQKFYILRRLEFGHLTTFDDLPPTAAFMIEKIQTLDIAEAEEILKQFLEDHDTDLNIPNEEIDFVELLVEKSPRNAARGDVKTMGFSELEKEHSDKEHTAVNELVSLSSLESMDFKKVFDWELQAKTEAGLIAYWSPYPEVRSVTDPYDDASTPCETWRVYFLGMIWVAIGSVINEYFYNRMPSISLRSLVVQLFLYPCGKFLEAVVPKKTIKIWKWSIELNPGPWSHKEQLLATLCYSVSGAAVYASSFITLQKLDIFYGEKFVDFGYQILLVLASNFMGFGFAGIFRKFVIYPVHSIWPTILPTLALNKALIQPEKKEKIHGWTISRYSFFFAVFAFSFLWFWVPDYLFTALSSFNWITWIAPNNLNLATITGMSSGLGLNPISTFDWNIMGMNSPLAIPFFAQLNNFCGMIIGFFVIVGLWWTNYKWTAYLPINSNQIFTNQGEIYQVQAVLLDKGTLDQEKYEKVGPPFYSAANLVVYGAFFAVYPLNVVYVLLTDYKRLWFAIKSMIKSMNFKKKTSAYDGFNDPFSRSMTKYKEVPEWCFLIILLISVVFAIVCVKAYPLNTPVWTIFFALGMNFVFLLPFCVVYSTTGTAVSINVLLELIIGYALPGNGTALNFVKTLGTNIDAQAENYITNQKQAHYLRIPPRALFRVQMISSIIYSFVSVGVLNLAIDTIEDYCTSGQPQRFSCPNTTTFYSASVLWGVIGPKKVFGHLYPVLQWCFLIGFLLAFPCWALRKWGRKTVIGKYVHPVVVVFGFLQYAPYNLSYYIPGMILSFIFMYLIRKRKTAWWEKYNYILSGGMDAGVAFSSIIIFFAVQYHAKNIEWWGNTVNDNGIDAMRPSRLNVTTDAPDGYFGPRIGHFP